jgi:hypothetical protein
MLVFKDIRTLDEWAGLAPTLRNLIEWIWLHAWPTSTDLIVTRIQGPPIVDESGVHQTSPHRALDISTRALVYTEAKRVERAVNASWSYDAARPEKDCALYHDAGSGYHLHIQVHSATAQRPEPLVTT